MLVQAIPYPGRAPVDPIDPALLFAAGEAGGWYDPSDRSTLWQDTAGTMPVTAAGQPVARIDDKSGNGGHLTQATVASQPTFQLDGNGNAFLSFDGVDDRLFNAAPIAGAVQSAGMAIRTSSAAVVQTAWCAVGGSADRFSVFARDGEGNASTTLVTPGSVVTASSGALTGDANHLLLVEADKSVPSNRLRIDGRAQFGSESPSSGSPSAGRCMGAQTSGSLPLAGRIYGIVHVARALSADERAGLESWLASRAEMSA